MDKFISKTSKSSEKKGIASFFKAKSPKKTTSKKASAKKSPKLVNEEPLVKKNLKKGISNIPSQKPASQIKKTECYKDKKSPLISSEEYDPEVHAPFEEGQCVPFFLVADTFDALSNTTGKDSGNKKKDILARMMLSVIRNAPSELDELYFFATRRIESDYIQKDLGIGKETVVKAGASSINKGLKEFREAKKKI